jgi:endonuclease IV
LVPFGRNETVGVLRAFTPVGEAQERKLRPIACVFHDVEPLVRGVHTLGGLRIDATDPLGLFAFDAQIDCRSEIVVHPAPVTLRENTAGGEHAMARHFDTIARLWEHIGDMGIGFCLDTCHAWAAGEELIDAVERIQAITGRIDLVHCNDSRDAAGSGADRHANFGAGKIDPQLLVAVVKAAGAPVICETADAGRRDDIAFLRDNV